MNQENIAGSAISTGVVSRHIDEIVGLNPMDQCKRVSRSQSAG